MTEDKSVGGIGSVLNQFSINRSQAAETPSSEKDMFLELMLAQMENQDPLDPQDNGDFLAQLAQFSTVEGIENLNTSMNSFQQSFMSSQALQATALVGRQVEVEGDTAFVSGTSPLEGLVNLPQSSGSLQLQVYNSSGSIVRTLDFGTSAAGDIPFSWDGTDDNGNSLPADNYRVEAVATQQGEPVQLATSLFANVNSVTIGTTGSVTLNVENLGKVPLEAVNKFK